MARWCVGVLLLALFGLVRFGALAVVALARIA